MHWAKDELTSYISLGLEADTNMSVVLKAMGVSKIKIETDHQQGLLELPGLDEDD